MTTATLTINYSLPAGSVIDDPLWLRLQQDGIAADVATVADAAAVLDALYDIEPCVEPEEAEEEEEEGNQLTTDDLTEAASVIDYSLCYQEPDGSVNVTIRIIRSDLSWPYVLRISGGRVVAAVPGEAETPVEIRELYQQNIVVESASSIVLDYPVIGGFTAQWIGVVIGESGRIDAPTINRTGSTLHWSGNVTGIIAVSFNTVYEVATIRVDGIDGEQGAALVRCFYHGLVEELEPILPESAEMDRSLCPKVIWKGDDQEDEVECYQDIYVHVVCECSGREVDLYSYEQVVPCPEWAPTRCPNNLTRCGHALGVETAYEYVSCEDDSDRPGMPGRIWAVSDPGFYEKTCCETPKVTLPQCPEKRISYRGGEPITLGAAYYRQTYGTRTRIVPVSPPGGVCGEHIIRQVIGATNCCEGVPPLVWDTSISPEVMAPNSSAFIGVTGGVGYSLEWTVAGHGFRFQNGSTKITTLTGNEAYLAALVGACGTATITVTDGCSTVVGYIRSTAGTWSGQCRRIYMMEGALRNDTWLYRSNIAISPDGCYGIETSARPYGWDNPTGLPWRSIEHWLQSWNGSTWSSVLGGLWGADVLESDYQAMLAGVSLAVVYTDPGSTVPPLGDGSQHACGDYSCQWVCL